MNRGRHQITPSFGHGSIINCLDVRKIAMKRYLKIGLGFALSLGLIIWMAMSLQWQEISRALLAVHLWAFIPATAVIAIHFLLRTYRWQILLGNRSDVPLLDLWEAFFLGNFATFILPARAGEFVRPLYLSVRTPVPFSTALSSVVIERFLDLATVLGSFALIAIFQPGLPEWAISGAAALGVLAGGIFLFILVALIARQPVERLVVWGGGLLPKKLGGPLGNFAIGIIEGVQVLRGMRALLAVLLLTLAVWATSYLVYYVSFWFFDIEPSVMMAVVVGVVVALAVAAPSAPGFIGVFQAGCLAGFAIFGVSEDIAAAYAIVTHLHLYLIMMIYGPIILLRRGISLRGILAHSGTAKKTGI